MAHEHAVHDRPAHGHPAHDHPADHHSIDLDELLELDGVALREYLAELTDWVAQAAPHAERVLDLGAGTGTGTIALAGRFASVVAVDRSADRLATIRAKADGLGVTTVEADVDTGWPAVEPVDLVWAANCVHEFADPDRVLADAFATLRPGGMLAMTEMDSLPRFLPGDIESAWHAAVGDHFGQDWAPRLAKAGFTIDEVRTFAVDTPCSARYARAYLAMLRHQLAETLPAASLAEFDAAVARQHDFVVRNSRTTWLARRPA